MPGFKIADYDLLVLPGGAKAMEYIRQDFEVIQFIHAFHISGKVINSILMAPIYSCFRLTSLRGIGILRVLQHRGRYQQCRRKIVSAPVVVCDGLVTSPHYKYLGLWMKAALDEVEEKNDRSV